MLDPQLIHAHLNRFVHGVEMLTEDVRTRMGRKAVRKGVYFYRRGETLSTTSPRCSSVMFCRLLRLLFIKKKAGVPGMSHQILVLKNL